MMCNFPCTKLYLMHTQYLLMLFEQHQVSNEIIQTKAQTHFIWECSNAISTKSFPPNQQKITNTHRMHTRFL
ncbi:unnamed protein product [Musa textilis]